MLLILFLLVSRHSVVSATSGCHSSRNKEHLSVSFVSQGLSSVPDGIDPGTEVLILSHNVFVSLSWATYTTFTCLHELDLRQNLISTIIQSGPVLKNLQVLRLSNNKLTGLDRATFNSTPSLVEIYLDGNTISSLDNRTFSDLLHLEIINLSQNKLHVLPSDLLEHISSSSLKNLDLEGNCLQHLPDQFLASKPDLPYVFLSNNSWLCTCQVRYLKHFLNDQSHNVYIHTGPSSIENDPESVVCSAPHTLKGRAIMDLDEDEYCSSDTDTAQILTAPTTALTSSIIITVSPSTAPTTLQPTTPKSVESSKARIPTAPTIITPTIITPTTTEPTTTTSAPQTSQKMTPRTTTAPAESNNTPNMTAQTTSNPTTITPTTTEPTTQISTLPTTTPSTTITAVQPAAPTTTEPTTTTSTQQTTQTMTPRTTTTTAESNNTPITTAQTTNNPTTIKLVTMVTGPAGGFLSVHGGQRLVPWCWWLFITVLLLCVFSACFSCILFLWLIIIYITLYQPIKQQVHSSLGVTLRAYQVTADKSLTEDRAEEEKVRFLPPEMIRETQPVFRSVLFISTGDEDGEADEKRNKDEEKKRGTDTTTKIDLLPAVTLHREQGTESKEREEVFRKTLYRVISREEEIEGWKEVEENCWGMMERDKERREGAIERGKTRYSLILREERGSVMEGRKGETEWLVGEWEMRGGGQESSRSVIKTKDGCGLSDSTHMDTPESETPV